MKKRALGQNNPAPERSQGDFLEHPDAIRRRLELRAIVPVVLGAGYSTRMGYPKPLLPLGQDTFLTKILKTLEELQLPDACVILGQHVREADLRIASFRTRILINLDPGKGQISSIQLALKHLDPTCEGCLVWPVDQPAVSGSLVAGLIRLFHDSGALLVLPYCQGKRGHPAIFRRTLFRELLATDVNEGPKSLVLRHQHDTALFHTEETATIEDIDTPEDYRRLTGESLESALARAQEGTSPPGVR